MLTIVICVVVALIICRLWWRVDDYRDVLGWIIVFICFLVAIFFPILYGSYVAHYSDIVKVYDVTEIAGKYYYLDGKWKDVLGEGMLLIQSNELSVVDRKAPSSPWYWSIPTREAHIPVVKSK